MEFLVSLFMTELSLHQIGAPAAVFRDLALSQHERRLAENSKDGGAVVQTHFADAETRWLFEKDPCQSGLWHGPNLDSNADSRAIGHADHRRMVVIDAP